MARLFILFLIALLPLRGWTAERMVFQMDHGAPVSAKKSIETGMSEDCALHMQTAQLHGSDTAHGSGHSGCQACQLCMPLAALDVPMLATLAPVPHAVPMPGASTFVSADTALHAKPPIS